MKYIRMFVCILLVLVIFWIYSEDRHLAHFDTIYVITLERTKERAYPLLQTLEGYGYRPEIFYGVDGKQAIRNDPSLQQTFYGRTNPGEIGCWLSHYHCLQKIATFEDHKKILILEDDADVKGPFVVPPLPEYDVLFVGHVSVYGPWESFLHSLLSPVWRSQGHGGSHAYAVTPQGARKILEAFEKNHEQVYSLPIDLAYIQVFQSHPDIRVFTLYPIQVHQKDEGSVIHETYGIK